jgi:Zn-dependent protease
MNHLSSLIVSVPAILFCVTIHEYAHALVAYRLGDFTAKSQGRLTLNPFRHLDLLGTLALLFFRVGWAKPVPINPWLFKNPKRDILLSSLSGPLANFLGAALGGILLRPLLKFYSPGNFFVNFLIMLFYYNVILGTFNLIPIPPLDGSKIIYYFLSEDKMDFYYFLERYGFLILLSLIIIGEYSGFSLFALVMRPVLKLFSVVFIGQVI